MAAGAATARLVTLVTPREKREIEAKARRLGFSSVGELVRTSVRSYGSSVESLEPELELMLRALEEGNQRAIESLENAERAIDATLAYFDARSAEPQREHD
jgi:hypothetical protein